MKKIILTIIYILLIALALMFFLGNRPDPSTDYDLLIQNGTVYDGTLADPYVADIGIKGDKIIAVGNLKGTAQKTINAQGLIVTPGFIDVHNHADFTFKYAGLMRFLAYFTPDWTGYYNYLTQGVTTVISGNCGLGYTNVKKWLAMVNRMKFGTNVYHLAPHGEIRLEIFGKDQPETLTPSQLEKLKKRFAHEMENGAIGFSSGLEYAPGDVTKTEELIEIAKVVKKYGGIHTSHTRDLTGPGVLTSVQEAIKISRAADIPVQISHIQINSPWDNTKASQIIELIEQARAEGLDITADQHPYNHGLARLTIHVPPKFCLSSTTIKEKYKTEPGRSELKKAVLKSLAVIPADKILISVYLAKPKYQGQTIAEIAQKENKNPADMFIELLSAKEAPAVLVEDQKEEVVRELMPHDYIFTVSDGWWTSQKSSEASHPRAYGAFPRKIKKYVLEEKLMSLKDALRSMTSLPAQKFNLKKRGQIKPGYYADIAVIDLNTIAEKATYKDSKQYSTGIVYLIVNGVLTIENRQITGQRGGKGLKYLKNN
ncbi:D-aminoacylase [bacterium]|jgi:N-acyl-D-amino-acid deacylase|nr:D-aminoacylase [bacterium]